MGSRFHRQNMTTDKLVRPGHETKPLTNQGETFADAEPASQRETGPDPEWAHRVGRCETSVSDPPSPGPPPSCPSRSVATSVAQARKARLGEAQPVAHATQQARSSASAARAASLPRPPLPPRLRNAAPPSGRRASLLGDGHHPGAQGVLLPSTSGPGSPPPPGVR